MNVTDITDAEAEARAKADFEARTGLPWAEAGEGGRAQFIYNAKGDLLRERKAAKPTAIAAPSQMQAAPKKPRKRVDEAWREQFEGETIKPLPPVPGEAHIARAHDLIVHRIDPCAVAEDIEDDIAKMGETYATIVQLASLRVRHRALCEIVARLAGPALLKKLADDLEKETADDRP